MRTTARSVRARALLSLFALLALAGGLLLTSAPALAAEACPNEAFRQGPSAYLPSCRVYEQVSPGYKGGYGVVGPPAMVSPDGERVAFESFGVFAGDPLPDIVSVYFAQRVEGVGWRTSPLAPPLGGVLGDFSSTFESVLAGQLTGESIVTTGARPVGASGNEDYLVHNVGSPDTSADWEVFGGMALSTNDGEPFGAGEAGADEDLCHIVLQGNENETPLLPEAEGTDSPIYDFSRGCGGEEPDVRLVGVNNEGAPINPGCPVRLGLDLTYARGSEQTGLFHAVNADGSAIFFTTDADPERGVRDGSCADQPARHQLFVRLGGERTVEVSKPVAEAGSCLEVIPCPGSVGRASANFMGASEDGSRVFFTSGAPLVPDDTDKSSNLYFAVIGCPGGGQACGASEKEVTSLAQVSHDPNVGQAADVLGVVRVAPDGSHVYFVAGGVLSEGSNAEGRAPIAGADNLYAYDAATGATAFVADLCSGPSLSGQVEDSECPTDLSSEHHVEQRNDDELWGDDQEADSTPDGNVLVFSSYGQLSENDANTDRDIYRYDARTGLLTRISTGEDGYDANGNTNGFDASVPINGSNPGNAAQDALELRSRSVSDDGQRIVFSTERPLSARAVNGRTDIYEWYGGGGGEGRVSMISSGTSPLPDTGATISPSGRDIFFTTVEGLVPSDTDGLSDIYDARIDGGFPPAPAPRQACSGDACQGPLSNPAPLLVPGSVSQAAGGNFEAPAAVAPRPKVKPKTKSVKCKRGYVKKQSKCVRPKLKKASKSTRGGKS